MCVCPYPWLFLVHLFFIVLLTIRKIHFIFPFLFLASLPVQDQFSSCLKVSIPWSNLYLINNINRSSHLTFLFLNGVPFGPGYPRYMPTYLPAGRVASSYPSRGFGLLRYLHFRFENPAKQKKPLII